MTSSDTSVCSNTSDSCSTLTNTKDTLVNWTLFQPFDCAEDALLVEHPTNNIKNHCPHATFLTTLTKYLNEYELSRVEKFMDETIPSTSLTELMSIEFLKNIMKQIPTEYRKELTDAKRSYIVKAALTAAVIRHIIQIKRIGLPSPQELMRYSFHQNNDPLAIPDRHEVLLLLGFIRSLRVLLSLGLDGVSNKLLFLNVCSLLEGSGKIYATGGAPSKAAKRREIVQEDLVRNAVTLGIVVPRVLGNKRSISSTEDDSAVKIKKVGRPRRVTEASAPKKRGRPRKSPIEIPLADNALLSSVQELTDEESVSPAQSIAQGSPHSDITGESDLVNQVADIVDWDEEVSFHDALLLMQCLADDDTKEEKCPFIYRDTASVDQCIYPFSNQSHEPSTVATSNLLFASTNAVNTFNTSPFVNEFICDDPSFYFDPSYDFMFSSWASSKSTTFQM